MQPTTEILPELLASSTIQNMACAYYFFVFPHDLDKNMHPHDRTDVLAPAIMANRHATYQSKLICIQSSIFYKTVQLKDYELHSNRYSADRRWIEGWDKKLEHEINTYDTLMHQMWGSSNQDDILLAYNSPDNNMRDLLTIRRRIAELDYRTAYHDYAP